MKQLGKSKYRQNAFLAILQVVNLNNQALLVRNLLISATIDINVSHHNNSYNLTES